MAKAATRSRKAKPASRAKPVTKAKPATKGKPRPATKPRPAAAKSPPSPAWQAVVDALGGNPGITRRGMFGADGLCLATRYFAMTWRGALVVKLPRERVAALIAAGTGTAFDPGGGRPMREWLQVPPGAHDWLALAEEALAFVGAAA